jgi:hypothetical protein
MTRALHQKNNRAAHHLAEFIFQGKRRSNSALAVEES